MEQARQCPDTENMPSSPKPIQEMPGEMDTTFGTSAPQSKVLQNGTINFCEWEKPNAHKIVSSISEYKENANEL